METEKVCARCGKHCVPAQSYCPMCGGMLPDSTIVPPSRSRSVTSVPERVPLNDDERVLAERDIMTSEVWREHRSCDSNTTDEGLPAGAIRIPLIEYAADAGELYAVKVALNRGGDPNESSFVHGTVLHAAVRSGNLEIVRLLVEQGADSTRVDHDGKTAAQVAKESGSPAIADYLNSTR